MLHLDTWVASPGQGRPLLDGTGLLHSRFRVFSPPPQEAEHWPQLCQFPQLPSTVNKNGVNPLVFTSPHLYNCHFKKGNDGAATRSSKWNALLILLPGVKRAHQDTCQCCTSESASLAPHKLFHHWRDEGYRMCGTAASALHCMSGCTFPSHSKDSSYRELQQRTIGEVLNNDIHPKSTVRCSPGTEKKYMNLWLGNFWRQMVWLLFWLETGDTF